jgi:ABC-type transport system involved in cytochrome c biogenesis permease subunit
MLKSVSTILGLGLVVLWVAGLSSPDAANWMTWLDGLAALCAFGIAAYATPYATRNSRAGMPIVLSVGLFILWLAGQSAGVVPWMSWWNFAFACAFLILGIYSMMERRRPVSQQQRSVLGTETHTTVPPTDIEKERTRRSA